MRFLMYYILRKFFVRLEFSDNQITLQRGFLIQKITVLPLKAVVKVSVERPLLLRIFRAKEVRVLTLRGGVRFYLHKDEPLPLLATHRPPMLKTGFGEQAFGAFIETRALSGIAVFIALLRRIGSVFGDDYYNRAISAIFSAAENVARLLSFLHIAVPRIAAVIAVFTAACWLLAYLKNLAKIMRLRVGRRGNIVTVTGGLITLYEHTLVLNSATAVTCCSVASLISERAPIYLRGVMIHPAVRRKNYRKFLRAVCGISPEKTDKTAPPAKAFFGYCLAPIVWSVSLAATVTLFSFSEYFQYAMLIKTALYCGLTVSVYTAAVYLLYFRHSGIALGERFTRVAARRAMRLYTNVFPNEPVVREKISQSVFQRRSGLCNYKLCTHDRIRLIARQLPKSVFYNKKSLPFH